MVQKIIRALLAIGLALGLTVAYATQAQAAIQRSCSPPEDQNKVWMTVYADGRYSRWSATAYFKEVRSLLPDQHWYWRYINYEGERWTSTASSGSRYGSGVSQNVIGHWREATNGVPGYYTYWNCGVSIY